MTAGEPTISSGPDASSSDHHAGDRSSRTAASWRLDAGVVAHNEERNLAAAVRSLFAQQLPAGAAWNRLWLVVSGCTDRTEEIARSLAAEDPRINVLREADRGGKARAIGRVLDHAAGDGLVLLNADARAAPGAVAALIDAAGQAPSGAPFAVMGRPRPRTSDAPRPLGALLELMWDVHHDFHDFLARSRHGGTHLSDELLLLSLPFPCALPADVVNDGSYFGVWLAQHGGRLLYAPTAEVETEAPLSLGDHFSQRRRIHFGNFAVADRLGAFPSTVFDQAVHEPGSVLRLLGARARRHPHRFLALATLDALAWWLARWDRLPPARSYVQWPRIRGPPPGEQGQASAGFARDPLGDRLVRLSVLDREFRTQTPVDDLLRLLPEGAPSTAGGLLEWIDRWREQGTPGHGLETGGTEHAVREGERHDRGARYLSQAQRLVDGPLAPTKRWIRCIGVTGSTAYGAPEAGDDLDLFVVARRGFLWWFLAYALVAGRIARLRRSTSQDAVPCFNRLLDEDRAADEFSRPQGLLFAREALAMRPLWGESYYRRLLARARWMEPLWPRLYRERSAPVVGSPEPAPSRSWKLLNGLVMPWLAAFLQLQGVRRNGRFARQGRADRSFRTTTSLSRFVLSSDRFEQIRAIYEGPVVAPAAQEGPPAPLPRGLGTGSPNSNPMSLLR